MNLSAMFSELILFNVRPTVYWHFSQGIHAIG